MKTTPELVSGLIEVDENIDLMPFIQTAAVLCDELLADTEYSNSRLELIERWLAAHFYAIRDNRIDTERAGSVSASYQYKLGTGLQVTMYGQQVLRLDTSGAFAKLDAETNKPVSALPKIGVLWLGSCERNQPSSYRGP